MLIKLNNKIYEKRLAKNITQEDLAITIGVTRQTVIAIEKGNYMPSLGLAFKLAIFFGVKVEELFWYDK